MCSPHQWSTAVIFAAKNPASNTHAVRADHREDASSGTYVEPSPCMVMPAIDLSALIPARFSTPRTIVDYLT
jgi:hypothetical protein